MWRKTFRPRNSPPTSGEIADQQVDSGETRIVHLALRREGEEAGGEESERVCRARAICSREKRSAGENSRANEIPRSRDFHRDLPSPVRPSSAVPHSRARSRPFFLFSLPSFISLGRQNTSTAAEGISGRRGPPPRRRRRADEYLSERKTNSRSARPPPPPPFPLFARTSPRRVEGCAGVVVRFVCGKKSLRRESRSCAHHIVCARASGMRGGEGGGGGGINGGGSKKRRTYTRRSSANI